jgi:E3 ubiquitin-protein ligase BIG BROTHER-like protein
MDKTQSGDDVPKTNTVNEQSPNTPNTAVVQGVHNPVQENERNDRGPPQAAATNRTPFANLSQVDADLALARTLQEQERAYMMLTMNNNGGDYVSWEAGNYMHEDDDDDDFDDSEDEYDISEADFDNNDEEDEEEDAFDVNAHAESEFESDSESGDGVNPSDELDPSSFPNDEAYARALQDAEDRDMAARLLAAAGLNDMVVAEADESDEEDDDSQVSWPEADPDELSYEELIALSEVVGTENKGLSADTIASLPSAIYKSENNQGGTSESCVVCRFDYEDGETLTVLSCKHSYHSECINNWLKINKACPVCSAEVSVPGTS